MSRRFFLLCPAILISVMLFVAARQSNDPVFSQIDSMVKSLSGISGLPEKHNVPYARLSKTQLRKFLNKRIKRTLKPEELRADELTLKLFGLVPQSFDLKKSTVDLLTEQAAAFYDYQEKKLFLLEGASFAAETTTVAHELSHALVDQNFDLSKYMEETSSNDDENLAHTAVVEGQASWLMIAYDLQQSGQPPVPTMTMLRAVADSSQSSMADYPVLKASPLYIQQSLLFPYSEGTLFFDAVYHRMGKESFTAVFKDAPSDTSQIIHPDRYFARQRGTKPGLPELAIRGLRDLAEGSMGEFDHEILLEQFTDKVRARALSPHLRGGQFKIFEQGKERRPLLEYVSEWDSESDAATYFESYEKILQSKWSHCDASTQSSNLFAGTGDNGYFVTKLIGTEVSSIEGLDDREQWNHLKRDHGTEVALPARAQSVLRARF